MNVSMIKECNRALFLDRDGVININHGFVSSKDNFDFIDGIFDLVKSARTAGYLIVVITNSIMLLLLIIKVYESLNLAAIKEPLIEPLIKPLIEPSIEPLIEP